MRDRELDVVNGVQETKIIVKRLQKGFWYSQRLESKLEEAH